MKKAGLANDVNYPSGGLGASRDFAVHYAKKGAYTALYGGASVGYDTVVDKSYVPKRGDIAIFARSPGGYMHHVGLVSSVAFDKNDRPSKVKVVHGNWSGKVAFTTFNMYSSTWGTMIVGYCTPNYTLNVTLNPNGGECEIANINALKGKAYGSLPLPEREGYTFLGWYTSKEGGKRVKAATKVSKSESHILYAQWSSDEGSVTDEDEGWYVPDDEVIPGVGDDDIVYVDEPTVDDAGSVVE
jgi:uncharacterized repeat protein (TIGR02543 family)